MYKRQGIVAVLEQHTQQRKVVLFFTGHAHAGKNMERVLANRAQELAPAMQMSDALAANVAGEFKTVLANCLAHGRRQVADVAEQFPQAARHVIEALAEVYKHDATCREDALSAPQRLSFHQEHSKPIMDELERWMNEQFDERLVEPNSGLGKALRYLIRHWDELTLFLRKAGAPLGRVEMWRGGRRSGLSVPAPFVWRCPSNLAVAPFPHPPRR